MYIDIATLSANYMQRYAFFCEFTSFLGIYLLFFLLVFWVLKKVVIIFLGYSGYC